MCDRTVHYLKGILAVGVFLFALLGWWRYLEIRMHAALAEEQTLFFEESLGEGLKRQNAAEVLKFIDAIRIYYPTGSKQKAGTHLDLMVERARSNAISQLETCAAHLESKSSKD
jgi:hypothetical protein